MQRRHCLSGIVSAADNIVPKVDGEDGPARKRRKLSTALIETSKVPSVAEHMTYAAAGQNEPQPCHSRQTGALPAHQSASLPHYQSVSLPPCQPLSLCPPVQPRASQHSVRTRRSSPALLLPHNSSSSSSSLAADAVRSHHGSDTDSRRTLLTRSHSDVSRDSVTRMSALTDSRRQLSSQHLHQQQQQQQQQHQAHAADYMSMSSTMPTPVYFHTHQPADVTTPGHPATGATVAPHHSSPTYLPLPITRPLTAAELACYMAATAPVLPSNPYFPPAAATARPSPPTWPLLQSSGVRLVPADEVLAGSVLPGYYGLSADGLTAAAGTQPAVHVSAPLIQAHAHYQPLPPPPPYHQHYHHQQHAPLSSSSSSVPRQQQAAANDTRYAERRHSDGVSSYHMTQLPRDLTQIAGDMTQIAHHTLAVPTGYQSDQSSAHHSVSSLQHLADMEAYRRHAVEARDWSMLSRSSEHAQPLFVHHFLSMLENSLGVHDSAPHLQYAAAPHFNYEALLGLARQLSESKPRGMCKADIDRLASFQFTSAAANHLSDSDEAVKQSSGAAGEGAVAQTSCVVCMSEFINRQRIRELPCQHIFHVKCIDKWLKTNRTCPLCRSDVLDLLNSDTKQFIH